MDENMNTPTYQASPQPPAEDNSTKILIFGILAVALCETVIGGIIFGILTKKELKAYEAAYGPAAGKVKVGKILGTVGLILSIVMAAYYLLVVCCAGCAACMAASDSYYYYS